MLLNIIFTILFVGGGVLLWFQITEKIPELVAIPDEVISERLNEDSAKLRILILHFKKFWHEGYFHDIFFQFVIKTLRRLHIVILRVDNWLVSILKKIQAKSNSANGEMTNAEYWNELKQSSLTANSRSREMHEVRARSRKRPPLF